MSKKVLLVLGYGVNNPLLDEYLIADSDYSQYDLVVFSGGFTSCDPSDLSEAETMFKFSHNWVEWDEICDFNHFRILTNDDPKFPYNIILDERPITSYQNFYYFSQFIEEDDQICIKCDANRLGRIKTLAKLHLNKNEVEFLPYSFYETNAVSQMKEVLMSVVYIAMTIPVLGNVLQDKIAQKRTKTIQSGGANSFIR